MTNLLFPTDFSINTAVALDWVRLFAHKTGATVTLLHVFRPMIPDTTLPTVGDAGMGVIASQEVEDISRRRLIELADELQGENISVQTDWRIGSVDDNILDAAREHSADLIVMGRSDLSTFFDRLAGSAVTDVADGAVCPVLIIPIPTEGKAIRPTQVKIIAYAMQSQTTQALVTAQTESLLKTFDAELSVLTDDELDKPAADLIVMQFQPASGFLDNLLHPNHVNKLIQNAEVPLLVYHEQK